jgi:hypothetical protein
MRPRLDRAAGDPLGQAAQIALERVEIDYQGRVSTLVEWHADLGGRVVYVVARIARRAQQGKDLATRERIYALYFV